MFIIIVSTLSLLLCAVAILFESVFFNTFSKKSYLIFLPASSVPIFDSFAIFTTSIFFVKHSTPMFLQKLFTYSVSSSADNFLASFLASLSKDSALIFSCSFLSVNVREFSIIVTLISFQVPYNTHLALSALGSLASLVL